MTLIILVVFGLMVFVKDNLKALSILFGLIITGMVVMSVISFGQERFQLSPVVWLFIQSLCLYIAYLTFQTVFFDRFIACFKIHGNVGFFIVTTDFLGYTGTVLVLVLKEFCNPHIDWAVFYNQFAGYVGIFCCITFICSFVYLHQRFRKENGWLPKTTQCSNWIRLAERDHDGLINESDNKRNKSVMKKISCVIMDWAGTAVDFGCFAPLNAFLKVFSEEKGIDITYRQAREPMGLLKIDHIKAILNMPEVKAKFQARYNRDWNMDDVNEMYRSFEKHLFSSLRNFTDPIPGVLDTMKLLREEGIKIGSTTGYTQAMMDVVRPDAAAKGYVVDNLVTPDDVPAGRPAPYMIYKNMIDLAIPSVDNVVKVGDTIADIKEGVNAKVWSIGIVTGSNEMGLTEEEYNHRSPDELIELKREVRERLLNAGAHFVLDNITELPACIEKINGKY